MKSRALTDCCPTTVAYTSMLDRGASSENGHRASDRICREPTRYPMDVRCASLIERERERERRDVLLAKCLARSPLHRNSPWASWHFVCDVPKTLCSLYAWRAQQPLCVIRYEKRRVRPLTYQRHEMKVLNLNCTRSHTHTLRSCPLPLLGRKPLSALIRIVSDEGLTLFRL